MCGGRETTEDKERVGRLPPTASALTSTCPVSGSAPEGPPRRTREGVPAAPSVTPGERGVFRGVQPFLHPPGGTASGMLRQLGGTDGTCHGGGTGTGAGGSLPAIVCAEAPAPPWRSWCRAASMTAWPRGALPAAPAAGNGKELCHPQARVSGHPAAGVSGRGDHFPGLFSRVFGVLPSPGPGCCRGGQNRQRAPGLSGVGTALAAPLAVGRRL